MFTSRCCSGQEFAHRQNGLEVESYFGNAYSSHNYDLISFDVIKSRLNYLFLQFIISFDINFCM